MLDIGWSELLVIGVVALIVIGPKDLPEMFRTLGRFTAKLRSMSREFSRAMETAANESGLKDAAKDIRAATSLPRSGLDAVKTAADKFEKWDPLKPQKTQGPAAVPSSGSPAPAAAEPAPAAPAPAPTPAPEAAKPAPKPRRTKAAAPAAPATATAEPPAPRRKAVTRKKPAPGGDAPGGEA